MATAVFPSAIAPLVDKVMALCHVQMTEGPVTAVTYIVNTSTETLIPVEMFMPSEMAKDVAADVVRWMTKNAKADATIMVSEAWTMSNEDAPRYQEIMSKYGSIGKYPGRVDVLKVDVRTRDGHWEWRATIETKGKARRCGALKLKKAEAGHFIDFLPEGDKPPAAVHFADLLKRGIPKPPTFPAQLAPLVDKVMCLCRAQMTEGPVTAMTYIVNSGAKSMIPVETYMPNNVGKQVSADVVRWMAKNANADATIMVSEAWTLSDEDAPKYKVIKDKYGSIFEYPGHLDILMVDVQTHEGYWQGRAPIKMKGNARSCGRLEVVKADHTDGFFPNVLPPKEPPRVF